MFQSGEKVVYGNNGVYEVSDITTLDSAKADKNKLYYVLKNISTGAAAYVPTDSTVYLRSVMSKAEAEVLIRSIPEISALHLSTSNPKELPRICKEILSSHDQRKIIGLIKHLKDTEQKKHLQRKKLSATEERYLAHALMLLGSELVCALGIEKAELDRRIMDEINNC